MKIYSDFKDYYDGALISFEEDAKVWHRKLDYIYLAVKNPGKEKSTKLIESIFSNFNWGLSFSTNLVSIYVVAGKTYPVLLKRTSKTKGKKYDPYGGHTEEYIAGWEQIEKAGLLEYCTYIPRTVSADIHSELRTPIFRITHKSDPEGNSHGIHTDKFQELILTLDAKASSGLKSVLSSTQIAQEIDRYMNNEMVAAITVEPRPTTDVEKAEAKGFDKKISFRHRK